MVSLTEGQKATLSPEAVKFLNDVHHPPFANTLAPLITSPHRVPALRRALSDKMGPAETELIRKHSLRVREITIADVSVVVIEPPNTRPEMRRKVLFNVFGGAFVMGSPRDRAALTMAAELGVRVYSVDYTLAPEARYPVARDQCLAVYRALVRDGIPRVDTADARAGAGAEAPVVVDPADVYAMGSSSGAQLLMSMLLVAKRTGLPLPGAGLYLCTPAVDLSGAGDSMAFNARDRDIMPISLLTGMVSQNYAPRGGEGMARMGSSSSVSPTDPLYSPVYADEYDAAFPPTVITVGTRDFALSAGVRLYWKLRGAGVDVELLVSEGMWHGFNWDPVVPEALRARAAVIEFLEHRK